MDHLAKPDLLILLFGNFIYLELYYYYYYSQGHILEGGGPHPRPKLFRILFLKSEGKGVKIKKK